MIRRAALIAPVLALLHSAVARAQARSITIEEAVSLALARHPGVRASEADIAIARGELVAARTLAFNPSITGSIGPATSVDTSLTQFQFGISQPLELGGKRAWRRRSADYHVEAAQARRDRQRALVAWNARRTFLLALIGGERAATAAEADSVGQALRAAATDRLALGAGTQLELNVAAAAHARDRRLRLDAERQLASALFELGAAVGAGAGDMLVPQGAVPRYEAGLTTADSLVSMALRQRTDFAATRAQRNAAESSVRLARALIWPDPAIGVSTGREEDFRVTQFTVSIPFPLWNRSRGEVAVAAASLDRARITEDSAQRALEFEVRDAHQALARAIASREAFDTEVIERLTENLVLADESFRAGKISLFAFNTIRRDFVDARLAYLDALAETVERRYALALAVGEPWE